MATAQKQRPAVKTSRSQIGSMKVSTNADGRSIGDFIPEKWRDLVAIALLFLSLIVFFRGVLDSSHTFNAGDNIAFESLKPFLEQSKAQGDNTPQWIPNIFGGMPSFALVITPERAYDLTHEIFDLIRAIPVAISPNPEMMTYIWHYFIFGVGMYLLLRATRNTSRLVALFAAFSAIFSTWIITYVMIGHNTKIFAVMTMPYIFLGIEKLRTPKLQWQRVVLWCSVLAAAFHFLFEANHPQMAFYIFLAVLLYYVVSLLVEFFRNDSEPRSRRITTLARSGVLALLMVGMAFAMSADRYLTTLRYEPYSIRGAAPINDPSNPENKASANHATTSSGGLDWNYATAWSFSPGEMITFIIPAYYGFGKMPYTGSELEQAEGKLIETYWGQMNGTDAANYTGIIVFFFGMIAIFSLWKRERLVPPLAVISIFAVLLSFGGNWPILFRPMFNFFPMFNKFRAPMMALVLMQLAFPILAALTFEEILRVWKLRNPDEDARLTKHIRNAMVLAGVFLAVSLLGRGVITSSVQGGFMKSKTASYYPEQVRPALASFAASVAANDALICALIATLACVLAFYLLKRRISPLIFGIGIFVLTVVDLWRVDSRPMNITSKEEYQSTFAPHDYIDFIKHDTTLYRVTDLTENNPSNVLVAYGLQTAGGYHAAKMREFQDVVDITGNEQGNGIYNPFMWNLLNTKYIIAPGLISNDQNRFKGVFQSHDPGITVQQGTPPQPIIVWENPQVLPRVFFSYRYEIKPKLDILHAMHDSAFTPRDVTYFDQQPAGMPALETAPIDTVNETIGAMQYHNEEVAFKTRTNGNRLVFMSDTWYPDWHATIDGKETPIYRANYAFRAIVVPKGAHDVKMTFSDPSYSTGYSVSLLTNVIGLLGFVVGAGSLYYRRKKRPEVEVLPPEGN